MNNSIVLFIFIIFIISCSNLEPILVGENFQFEGNLIYLTDSLIEKSIDYHGENLEIPKGVIPIAIKIPKFNSNFSKNTINQDYDLYPFPLRLEPKINTFAINDSIFISIKYTELKEIYPKTFLISKETKKTDIKKISVIWKRIKEMTQIYPEIIVKNLIIIDSYEENAMVLQPQPNILFLSQKIIEKFSDRELEIMVTHEFFHLLDFFYKFSQEIVVTQIFIKFLKKDLALFFRLNEENSLSITFGGHCQDSPMELVATTLTVYHYKPEYCKIIYQGDWPQIAKILKIK